MELCLVKLHSLLSFCLLYIQHCRNERRVEHEEIISILIKALRDVICKTIEQKFAKTLIYPRWIMLRLSADADK